MNFLQQATSLISTPNLLNATLGANAGMVNNLLSGTSIGGAVGQLSTLTGALGNLQNIPSQLTGLLSGGGSNPFQSIIGGLSGLAGGASAGGGGQFQPNILSHVEQPAYHFRFLTVSDQAAKAALDGAYSVLNDGLIIAETGASKYNITDVELEGFVSPNSTTKNSNILNGTIRITEPYGAGFLDALYAASGQAGITNWMKATYFLEVKFHGYDPQSGQYMDMIGGEKWVIPCKILNLEVDINEAGAKYVLEIVNYDDFASVSHHAFINESASPMGATVGDVFNQLKITLEENQKQEYGYTRHKYNFAIHPLPSQFNIMPIGTDPSSWALQSSDFSLQPSRATDMGGMTGNTYVGVDLGEALKAFVTQVFSATMEGQQLISRSQVPQQPSNQADNAVIWKVQTQTRVRNDGLWYDQTYDDYNYEITYHIIPHFTFSGIMSVEQRADSSNQQLVQKKMSDMMATGRLAKQYKYLFTGENTEVINFDIKTNLAWFGYIPPTPIPQSVSTPPMMGDEQFNLQQMPDIVGQARAVKGQLMAAIGGGAAADAIAQLEGQLTSLLTLANQGMGVGSGRMASGGGGTYIEDLQIQGEKLVPISFNSDKDKTDKEYLGDAESTIQAGQQVYAMMIAQIFGTKATLMNLDITVRGDPYWLGNLGKTPGAGGSNGADYFLGDNAILIEFYFPQGIDEATGAPILNPANLFSGIFVVQSIKNKFSNGKFTQQLFGYRNLNTALQIGATDGGGGMGSVRGGMQDVSGMLGGLVGGGMPGGAGAPSTTTDIGTMPSSSQMGEFASGGTGSMPSFGQLGQLVRSGGTGSMPGFSELGQLAIGTQVNRGR